MTNANNNKDRLLNETPEQGTLREMAGDMQVALYRRYGEAAAAKILGIPVEHLTEVKQVAGGLDAIFFEEVHRHLGVDAAHAYGGFLAHVTAWCEHHQIPYEGVPVGTIKRHATGKGNANKEAMIAAMQSCGFSPGDDNEADALALLQWAREQRMDPVTIATKGAQPVLKGAYLWKFFHFAAVLRASATCCACCLLPRFAQPLQRPVIVSIFIRPVAKVW